MALYMGNCGYFTPINGVLKLPTEITGVWGPPSGVFALSKGLIDVRYEVPILMIDLNLFAKKRWK